MNILQMDEDRFDKNMILYRPVGLQELELIYDNGMKAFPARLPQQPIFYPVFNLEYARQIASDWNVKSGQFAGYVTQFKVEDEYSSRFEKHTVGGSEHQELWIPAEELEEFNKHIAGHIKVVEAYFGDSFHGFVPDKFGLEGKNAVEQFTLLANSYVYKRMDFYLELKRNHKAVFLNYPFWQKHEFKNQGLKAKVLQAIREGWLTSFPKIPLPYPVQEDVTLAKQTDSPSVDKHTYEDDEPVSRTDSNLTVNPVQEANPSLKERNSPSLVNPIQGKASLQKQTISPSLTNHDHENAIPVKQANSYHSINPVHKDIRPVKQEDSHFAQGVKLGLSGKYQEAVDELSKAVGENPDHAVAHTSLGIAHHRLGEDDRALSRFGDALRIDPKYAEAHYFRANLLFSHGDVREAIEGYTTAIGLKPELIEAHHQPTPQDRLTDYTDLPAGVFRIARHALRILDLNKSIETNPRQANLFKERASEYSRLGNYEQAIADYNSCLAIQPDDASVLHLRGLAYEQIGQSERAMKDFQQAFAANPQLSEIYIDRGVTFGKMGQFRQSIDNLTEGIRLAPKNPNGYFNRGATYLQQGDYERAIADFSMVIQLTSNDEDAYYWRGISHEEAGHQREAIADYEQFLLLSQNPQAREEIEQKLNQWNKGRENSMSSRPAVPDEKGKSNQLLKRTPDQHLDLYDLLLALGERAIDSTWFGSSVDCNGEKAEELYTYTDNNKPIPGRDLLDIASGIHQTQKGDFTAFDPNAPSHWVFIHAWEGSGFYVEINDPQGLMSLKTHFPSIEKVEDTPAPYDGLFIPV